MAKHHARRTPLPKKVSPKPPVNPYTKMVRLDPFYLPGEAIPKAQTIGILGAGLMGAGIAQVSIQKGFDVVRFTFQL